jgi:hypothetical protein
VYTQKLLTEKSLHRGVFHTGAFTQGNFYTEKLLHTSAFSHRSFYTEQNLHRLVFTHRSIDTQVFTHRSIYILQAQDPCQRGPLRRCEMAILPQFLALDLHSCEKVASAILKSQFYASLDLRHSFRAKGLRPKFQKHYTSF